jgi:hypothetical protein
VDYFPLLVERAMEVLVKEGRWPKAIPVAAPLQSSSDGGLQTLCFSVFDLWLGPLWK